MRWQVVIPQKPLARAKSRLVNGPVFAEAMVRDVIAACQGLDVELALLGGDSRLGVRQLPDGGGGLSAAVRAAVEPMAGPVAVLMGDLPCLEPGEVGRVLASAERVPFGVVADAAGTGTTLLTALVGRDLHTSYGAGSFARHLALGAVDLLDGAEPAPGLRRDVDTLDDLVAAAVMGVGTHTREALGRAGLDVVHPTGP